MLAACTPPDGARVPAPAAAAEPNSPVAAPVPTEGGVPVPVAIAAPRSAPVQGPRANVGHRAAQAALGSDPLAASDLVGFGPVVRGAGQPPPLAYFHAELHALQRGARDKVRVALYGASSVAGDRYPAYLRAYLQGRFGDGGPGFVAVVPLWRWRRHSAVRLTATRHWRVEHAQRKTGKLDGRYGLLGASVHTTNTRARAQVSARRGSSGVDSVELWYLAQPDGGTARVTVMGRTRVLDTRADAVAAGYWTAEPFERGPASLTIQPRGDGEVRLMGAVLERNDRGVVVDALGIGGTRAANLTLWDEPLWRSNLQRRAPALWVLAYGANESVDEDEPTEVYRAALLEVIARLRAAAPQASCLLVGPVDFELEVTEPEPGWVERERCTQIIAIQREVSAASGCGFFDVKAMMGGEGSMDAWVTADPPLAKPDHLHFTPLGYTHLGRVLIDAVMADYDDPPSG